MTTRRRLLALAAGAFVQEACRKTTTVDGRPVAELWFAYGGKNREVLLDLVQRFNRSQPHFFVRATFQGDYFECLAKLRTALAAGAAPAFTHIVGEVLPYLAHANVLEDLTAYPGAQDLEASLLPALAQKGSFVGAVPKALLAVPFNRSTPLMYANAERLTSAGLGMPETWDALRVAARSLTRKEGHDVRWGYEVPVDWWFWCALVGQAGGHIVESDGRITLGGSAGEKALRFWQTLVHEDHAMRPPPGRDYNAWQATNQDFLAGRAALIWTSTAFLRYLEDNARFPLRAAPLPAEQQRAVPTGGTFFVLLRSAPSAAKAGAWAFLRWFCEPAQTLEWARRTGYLPVTHEAIREQFASGYYTAHPNDRIAYEQLSVVQPWPWAPELFRIQRDVLAPRLEEAVLTGRKVEDVLTEARAAAQEV